jgi:rRNA biogenesis protein RRP5
VQDNEASVCAEVVHVGQLVPCMVLRVDDDKKEGKVNKRVWLSLRLSRMHKGLSLDAIQDGMVFIFTLIFSLVCLDSRYARCKLNS